MTISRMCYCNRDEAQRSIDLKNGLDSILALNRAMQSASENIEAQLHRKFYPWDGTLYWDWPNQGGSLGGQYAEPWRMWFNDDDLTCLTGLVSGGVTIPLTAIFLLPANNPAKGKPYFTYMELDRSQSYAFGNNSQTPQLSIAGTGTWAYGADADPAGTLAASVGSSDTTITVSNGALIGAGDLMVLGYGRGAATGSLPWAAGIAPYVGERILVTDVAAVATGLTQSGSGVTTASASDQALTWTGSGNVPNAGEIISLDQEQMLVEAVVSGIGTVRRAWNGTTLAAHSGASIYALRQLSVNRAQLGTSAVTASSGATVYRHRVPPLVRDLAIAESANQVLQEGSGYARTVGSGESAHAAPGISLMDKWDECRTRHGRKARKRAI